MEGTSNTLKKFIKIIFNGWTGVVIIALILALIIRSFLFSPFIVDGRSMENTLKDGERLFVNEIIYYFHDPEAGDIIVFKHNNDNYIKRVIGVAGDTVEVKDDELYINGELAPEPYLEKEKNSLHSIGSVLTEDFGPVEVEEGHIFVMGDNRDNSRDSRMFGTIKLERVIGRADLVYWPLSDINLLNN